MRAPQEANTRPGRPLRRGAVLAMALVTLLVLSLISGLVLQRFLAAHRQARRDADQLQAEWLAEAAVGRAIRLRQANADYGGETWQVEVQSSPAQSGVAEIKVEPSASQPDKLQITAETRYPAEGQRRTFVKRTYPLPPATKAEPAS